MEISAASEATCSSAPPPVASTLPFVDAQLSADAPSTDVVAAAAAVSATAAAALGNGVTIPVAAGMMKFKVMGRVKARVRVSARARRGPFMGLAIG